MVLFTQVNSLFTTGNEVEGDVRKMRLHKGTRIYYTGDMANREGFGTIVAVLEPTKYSPQQVVIKMDDGREKKVPTAMFSKEYKGHGGTRFVTEDAYRRWQQGQVEKLKTPWG
ncbi:MAG: hypothetical protein C4575_12525 [Desulforudis sp.]|nr:MAG: hypothetical protein C4575_12525 [Desulforudis sp.]